MAYPCCNNVMIFDILNLSSVCSIDVVVVCSGYYRASRTHTEYCCCCCFLFLFCTVQNFCEDFNFLPFLISNSISYSESSSGFSYNFHSFYCLMVVLMVILLVILMVIIVGYMWVHGITDASHIPWISLKGIKSFSLVMR